MTKTIAITTPTGNIGSKLVPRLLEVAQKGELQLVLLARKPEVLAHWAQSGARVHAGCLEDPDFLVRATRGVDVLYWATPNSFAPELTLRAGYRQFAESAATAMRANKIEHTVHISGFAHVDDGGGERSLFGGLADSEAILGRAVEELQLENPQGAFGITHIRAGFFFENLLGQLRFIRNHGRIYLPVNRKRRIPMVASQDVARQALHTLLHGSPRGRSFLGALGPEDLSFADVASSLSAGLGRKIRVIRLPRMLIRSQMVKFGRDTRTTDALMLAFGAISNGSVIADPPRDGASTTPMSMTQWAEDVLRPLVEGSGADVCPARIQYEAS